ncbi:MAG: hypothetical protein GYB65_08940 [Chloroflexi bacterium]|nr:hypothetical protein [Chloroflexota bacterium]
MTVTQNADGQSFTFRVQEHGIGALRATASLDPAAVQQQLVHYTTQHGQLKGLLLDVSGDMRLSLVNLTRLLESLAQFAVPISVVMGDESQQRLAALLRNTLPSRNQIAYFTASDDAWAFLRPNGQH